MITKKLIVKPASEYKESQIEWIWEKFLVRGKFHILGGQPGTAKTTIALDLAARITSGTPFPDGSQIDRSGFVVIWSDEDSVADVLKPRLIAANANLDNVFFIDSINFGDDKNRAIDPSTDLKHLYNCLPNQQIDLIIFDPITSTIKGDSNKQGDVRDSLRWITELAEERNCAILGISHFTKGTAGISPIERVTGSVSFTALARIVLVIFSSPYSDKKVFCIAKSNLSIDRGGFEFLIEETTLPNHIITTKIKWLKELNQSAQEITNNLHRREDQRLNHSAIDALQAILENGPKDSNYVKQAMKSQGYSDKQTRTARDNLNISIQRDGIKTFWLIPNIDKLTITN